MVSGVSSLAAGQARTIQVAHAEFLTVITGAGATATVSRVDSPRATAHTTGAENQFTVAATTKTVTAIDWPYYRISVAGGSLRYALV